MQSALSVEPRHGSPGAAPIAAAASQLLDFKGLARPPVFVGAESGFAEWLLNFDTAMSLLGLCVCMLDATKQGLEIIFADLSYDAREVASTLSACLASCACGMALAMVRLSHDPVPSENNEWS